jgi:hypothetical protein
MENKIKYAESSALKWSAEDFDSQVIAASEDGQTIQFKKDYFLSLSEEVKIQIIEEAISNVGEELGALISAAIYDEVLEQSQWAITKTENNG